LKTKNRLSAESGTKPPIDGERRQEQHTARRTTNGNRLEEAMATLINTQASFQANFLAMQASIDARFARIEDGLGELRGILIRHEAILQALPKAIRQEIGFKPSR
jgi:hypothetical protein